MGPRIREDNGRGEGRFQTCPYYEDDEWEGEAVPGGEIPLLRSD